jgi:hypothetical protein
MDPSAASTLLLSFFRRLADFENRSVARDYGLATFSLIQGFARDDAVDL